MDMESRFFEALKYLSMQGDMDKVHFVEDFNGQAYCGIEDQEYEGKWMVYYESPDGDYGNGLNPDLVTGSAAADVASFSKELACKVYLWKYI